MAEHSPSGLVPDQEFELTNNLLSFGDFHSPIQPTQSSVVNEITQGLHQVSHSYAVDISSSPLENGPLRGDQALQTDSHPDYGIIPTFPGTGSLNFDGLPEWVTADSDDDILPLAQSANATLNWGCTRLTNNWLRILQEGNSRYALRETDRNIFRGCGWVDADQSGDYNDDLESVENSEDSDDDERASKRRQQKGLSYEQGRNRRRSMLVRLKFSPETIEANGGMPGDFFLPSADSDYEFMQEGGRDDFRDSGYFGPKFPPKDKIGVITRRAGSHSNDRFHDHSYQNLEEVYDNLLGRREGRGCRECFNIGLECSLIDDCILYPCAHCKENNQDCIWITPRKQKHICERCKNKRLQCSFESSDAEQTSASCDHCQEVKAICITGPAKSFRIDDVLASIGKKFKVSKALPETQYMTCKECDKVKLKTLFPPLAKIQICKSCLQKAAPSKPAKAVPKKRVTKTKLHPRISNNHSGGKGTSSTGREAKATAKQMRVYEKAQAKKIESKLDSEGSTKPKFLYQISGGTTSFLKTSFCHPIYFNWVPPPPLYEYYSSKPSTFTTTPSAASPLIPNNYPCHFCTQPGLTYALAGLGTRTVEVVQWDYDPLLGYEELSNGWVQAGEESTRMCVSCTMARVLVNICGGHVIRAIAGLDARCFDFKAAMEGVVRGVLEGKRRMAGGAAAERLDKKKEAEVKWCSVCIAPAFYECCVRPPYTVLGEKTDDRHDIGCGLLLCEVCALRMTGVRDCRGRWIPVEAVLTLDEHITASASDSFHYPDGLRADVCFLKADSELMRRCCGEADEEELEGDSEMDDSDM